MTSWSRTRDDRGALLVYAALALAGLMAFCAVVVDYGVFWTARRQAQNAADSAATAAAISMAFDAPRGFPDLVASGMAAGAQNAVWGQLPTGSTMRVRIFNGALVPDKCAPGNPAELGYCARADVYRDSAHGNPLPTFFAGLLGVASQDAWAWAVGRSSSATAATCVRPIAVPDYFILSGTPTVFDYIREFGGVASLTTYSETLTTQGYYRIAGNGSFTGDLTKVLSACTPAQVNLGDSIAQQSEDPAAAAAAFAAAMQNVYDLDPGASWNGRRVVGSCVPDHNCEQYDQFGDRVADPAATSSPRIVIFPAFDPASNGSANLTVTNFVAFFITHVDPGEVDGILLSRAGLSAPGVPLPPAGKVFLRTIELIR